MVEPIPGLGGDLRSPVEDRDRLSSKPLVQLEVDGIIYAVGSVYEIDQQPTLRSEPVAVPEAVQRLFLSAGDGRTQATYEHIESEGGINHIEIVQFVQELLANQARYLAAELGIQSLDLLTPKQAILLSTRLITDFTQYSAVERAKQVAKGADHLNPKEPNEADVMTPLELLRNSVAGKATPGWQGLGVCRNFSVAVRAVFDSLKARQAERNLLQNVYCTIVSDYGGGVFEPRPSVEYQPRKKDGQWLDGGHAWNQFVTVIDNGAEVIGVDATWDQHDPDTMTELNELNSLVRIEADISKLMRLLQEKISGGDQAAQKQYREGLNFYDHLVYLVNTESNVQPSWRAYVMESALSLLAFAAESRTFGPKTLANDVVDYYKERAGGEIAHLFQVGEVARVLNRNEEMSTIYDRYVSDHMTRDWSQQFIIWSVSADAKALQAELLNCLRTKHADAFAEHLKTDPSFRAGLRDFNLEPTLTAFEPWSQPEDYEELKYILGSDEYDEPYVVRDLQKRLSDRAETVYSETEYKDLVATLRGHLRELDPVFYDSQVAGLSDYKVIRWSQVLKRGNPPAF